MGLVTDILWECPKCETKNKAQIYGEWDDPEEFPRKAVPIGRTDLKWNPPCEGCGEYYLSEPDGLVEMPIKRVTE